MASTRPPTVASSLCILLCMALSVATSKRPRPSPDWLDATTTCQPAWLSLAIASSAPGSGFHSASDLTKSSLSSLMVPSRSRMTSFIVWVAGMSGGQAGQVSHAVHGIVQALEQAQAVGAQRGVFGIDHHTVEESIDRRLEHGQLAQRSGVFAIGIKLVGQGLHAVQCAVQGLLGRLLEQLGVDLGLDSALGFLED